MSAKPEQQQKTESLLGAIRHLKLNLNADTVFAFSVISRAVMAQGNGLSFNQVKAIIDAEFKPIVPEPGARDIYPMPWD